MKVFKFGGASVNSPQRFLNAAAIIQSYLPHKLLVVVSAMGKTTNALEEVTRAFYDGHQEQALSLFHEIKKNHIETVVAFKMQQEASCMQALQQLFTETEWILHDKPVRSFDYYYDQIVCCGELFSTTILTYLLEHQNMAAKWIDVRDVIKTDNHFRNASILWEQSQKHIEQLSADFFANHDIIVTQGFIGSTDQNESTTLGREGSDYSAAVFSNMLNAESLTIWKDVEAVMSADPKKYPEATAIDNLSYSEVVEMAYYGAQVIHPKTIKPLQNKKIPLFVKSFINPELKGTIIRSETAKALPPIIVNKSNQVLITFTTKDFSFIEGETMNQLLELFKSNRISPNISQQTAISLLCGFDDIPDKIESLSMAAAEHFDVVVQKNLTLLTVRHYNDNIVEELTANSTLIMKQQTPRTIQILFN